MPEQSTQKTIGVLVDHISFMSEGYAGQPEGQARFAAYRNVLARHGIAFASEAHLARALVNLVHNAVDAIAGAGEVVVRTRGKQLQQPHFGYETVPPGEYALVEVSDTGVGLQMDSVGRLFEPFFSTKEVEDQSGTGQHASASFVEAALARELAAHR